MEMKPINNERDYKVALDRLESIFDAAKGTKAGDELEILSLLIDNYENEHFPVEMPDPIAAITFRMEQMEMTPNDLAKATGFKSRINEVLNKKRKLTLKMIRKLSSVLNIPTEVLVQDYAIE